MNKIIVLLFTLFPFVLIAFTPEVKTIMIEAPIPETVTINDKNIIPQSIKVTTGDIQVDFTYDGAIKIENPSSYMEITIEYSTFPNEIFKAYQLYEPFDLTDSTKVQSLKTNWETSLFDNQRLNITGSKTMSVSVSNQQNFDLNQSLFLQIDGEIANNVNVQAQLNDNHSPITADGSSKDLSSLDEVFFRVYGKEYDIAFGDLRHNITGTQFINYNPKFEGLKLSYFDRHKATFAVAISNSKSEYISFMGVEGKQGPYYLRPNGYHSNVQIIPDTETIWLNGVVMQRGNDYRIDYNEGTIDFFLKHFISGNSRIQASFQYTDENYRKNAVFSSTEFNITDRLRFSTAVIYQNDDKNHPLTFNLSESDIDLLKKAGNNKVYISGEQYMGAGNGLYKKENEVYIYAFNDPTADFDVTFTYVGANNGDYRQITPSRFDHVGENLGDYMPIRELYMPEKKANYDFSLKYDQKIFDIYVESLVSEFDKNVYSSIDNNDNISSIHHFQARIYPDWDLFSPNLTAWYRYRQRNLFTYANIIKLDNQYSHYAFATVDSLNSHEYNLDFEIRPYSLLNTQVQYQRADFEGKITNEYLNLSQSSKQKMFLPELSYRYFNANNINHFDNNNKYITIHEPASAYTFRNLTLKGFTQHFKETQKEIQHSQILNGYKLDTYFAEVSIVDIKKTSLSVAYQNDTNHNYQAWLTEEPEFHKSQTSDTYTVLSHTNLNSHSFSTLYSHRIVYSYLENENTEKYDIAELRTQNSLFNRGIRLNSSYILKNTEFFPKTRELIYIGEGAGLYDSTGVYLDKGGYDWKVAIMGDPICSTEVIANLNSYTYPANFVKRNSEYFELLSRFNLETNISIIEQTSAKDRVKVYLLNPSALFNDESLYAEQEFRQVVWVDILKNRLNSKYSFREDKTFDNRYTEGMRNYVKENEISLRLLKYISSDFEGSYKVRTERESRYDMNTNTDIYRLNIRTSSVSSLIFNTTLGYELESIHSRGAHQNSQRYTAGEEILYFIGHRYRLNTTFTYKYNDVTNPITSYIPYDKQHGNSLNWLIGMDYRMNRFSTCLLNYSGYKQPTQETNHQLKIEIRAEF